MINKFIDNFKNIFENLRDNTKDAEKLTHEQLVYKLQVVHEKCKQTIRVIEETDESSPDDTSDSNVELLEADPNCDHKIINLWSGIKCKKCNGWFCY